MHRFFRISATLILLVAFLSGIVQAMPIAQSAPGDLDPTFAGFGAGGLAVLANTHDDLDGMALQRDGKIVVVSDNGPQTLVQQFLSNGLPDTTFAANGSAIVIFPGFDFRPSDVAVQANGAIVLAGTLATFPLGFVVARLTKAGALDSSFGNGGFVTTDFAPASEGAGAVLVQRDGKIVAAGFANIGGDDDFAVARYTATGALDSNFSGDGKITFGFGGDDVARDIAQQDDGKLVLAGANSGFDSDFALARLNINGTLDSSFDSDGKVSTGFGDLTEKADRVAIQPDGKIVATGSGFTASSRLARYLSNGALDTSFAGKASSFSQMITILMIW